MKTHRTLPLALGVAAAVAVLGLAVVAHRAREQSATRYRRAALAQERDLARALPERDQPGERPMGSPVCITGIDTFATAIAALMTADLRTPGPARREVIAAISSAAVRAERLVENAAPAPTLPRRLGSVTAGGPRRPVDPPRTACQGRGYASFSMQSPGR